MAETEVRKIPPPPPPKKISLKHLSTERDEPPVKDPYAVSSDDEADSECEQGPPPKIDIGKVDIVKLKTDLMETKDGAGVQTATDVDLVHARPIRAKWESGQVETASADDETVAARQVEMEQLRKTSLKQRFSTDVDEEKEKEKVKKQSSEEEPEFKLAGKARRKFQIIDAHAAKAADGEARKRPVVVKQHVESAQTAADAPHSPVQNGDSMPAQPATETEAATAEMELRQRKQVTFTPETAAEKSAGDKPDRAYTEAELKELDEVSWGHRKMNVIKERGKRRKQIIKSKLKILSYVFIALLFALIVILIIRFFQK